MTPFTSLRSLGALVSILGLSSLALLGGACDRTETPDASDTEHLGSADSALTADQCDYFDVNGKIQICHYTGSGSHPYKILKTSVQGCAHGHAGHPDDYVAVDDPTCQGGGCLPTGAPCDATLPCCSGSSCQAGTCVHDPCASNPCVSGSTCVNTPDAFYCACPASCTEGVNECQQAGCDPTNGQCSPVLPLQDGTPCANDGNPCTTDVCQAGQCAHVAGPPVCNGNNCDSSGLVCNQQSGDCATGDCSVAQDTVPGAPGAQTITLENAAVQVAPGTQIQLGGMPSMAPVNLTVQEVNVPGSVPAAPPTTDAVLYPVYKFGPSGAQFSPPLLLTIDVPLTATSPSAWLCDDTGLDCEQREGFLTLDSSVSPPRQTLTITVDHFSTVVVTQSATAVPTTVCLSLQRGLSGSVEDSNTFPGQVQTLGWSATLAAGKLGSSIGVANLKWDISAIPTGASVTSATLNLHRASYTGTAVASKVYALTGAWSEAAVTAANQPGYNATLSATTAFGAGNALRTQADVTAIVQKWKIGTIPNHGVEVTNSSTYGYTSYHSSEATNVSLRPSLDVCYTVGCPGPGCTVASGPGPVTQVAAGGNYSCALKADGSVTCWGGQTISIAAPIAQISASDTSLCARRADGTALCTFGPAPTFPGTFTQVAAGASYSCGITTGSTLACWGNAGNLNNNLPFFNFKQISVGGAVCGVRTADNSIQCVGTDFSSQFTQFVGAWTQVATSSTSTACGISGNFLSCYGNNAFGEAFHNGFGSNLTQVGMGHNYGCVLEQTGRVRCWGRDDVGQASPPAYKFTQISVGMSHACGVTAAGTVVCWGANGSGQSTIPAAFTTSPTCSDGVKNGNETDIDCGGTCPACNPASCLAIKTANAAATDGMYAVSPGGNGPFQAYCDMTNGGWTLIQSHNAGVATSSSAASVGLASATYLQANLAQALANVSTSVRITRRNTTTYVQSADSDPITRLRALAILNDPAHKDGTHWTGTALSSLNYGCTPNPNAYPDLYSACNNETGMHVQAGYHTFSFDAGAQDIDVWVR